MLNTLQLLKCKNLHQAILSCLLLNSTISYAQTPTTTAIPETLNKTQYQLLFKDDFDGTGTPSPADWLLRKNHKLGGSSVPGNVLQKDGILSVLFTQDSTASGDEKFKGGGIVSAHNFGYGYYEAKVKLYGGKPELSGFHQSFWSMGLTGTNEAEGAGIRQPLVEQDNFPQENRVLEIDGFEMDSRGHKLAQNYHIYTPVHTSEQPNPKEVDKDVSKWIIVGYEWLPDRINFYCDHKFIGTKWLKGKWQVYAPQNVWLTALPIATDWSGPLLAPPIGAAMQADYFKFYAKNMVGVNRIGNADFEHRVLGGDPSYPVAWIVARTKGNDTSAVKVITDSTSAKNGNRFLQFQSDKEFKATAMQVLQYIPNGKYVLTAWVKSRGTKKQAEITVISGTTKKTIKVPAYKNWTKVSLNHVSVQNTKAIIKITTTAGANQKLQVDGVTFSEM